MCLCVSTGQEFKRQNKRPATYNPAEEAQREQWAKSPATKRPRSSPGTSVTGDEGIGQEEQAAAAPPWVGVAQAEMDAAGPAEVQPTDALCVCVYVTCKQNQAKLDCISLLRKA